MRRFYFFLLFFYIVMLKGMKQNEKLMEEYDNGALKCKLSIALAYKVMNERCIVNKINGILLFPKEKAQKQQLFLNFFAINDINGFKMGNENFKFTNKLFNNVGIKEKLSKKKPWYTNEGYFNFFKDRILKECEKRIEKFKKVKGYEKVIFKIKNSYKY